MQFLDASGTVLRELTPWIAEAFWRRGDLDARTKQLSAPRIAELSRTLVRREFVRAHRRAVVHLKSVRTEVGAPGRYGRGTDER
jgi:hypothetical protein